MRLVKVSPKHYINADLMAESFTRWLEAVAEEGNRHVAVGDMRG